MVKILHIAEAFGGGVFTFLSELCNGLCESFDIAVAYSVRSETPENPSDYFDRSVSLIEMRYGKREISPVNDIRYLFEIKKLVKSLNPDILHLHSSKAGFVGRIAAIGLPVSHVFYTAHGYAFLKGGGGVLKRGLYYALEKLAGMTNSVTVAVGMDEYRLAGKLSKRVCWVNNGVNLSHISKFEKPYQIRDNPVVAAMGRVEYMKNPALFNEIAKILPQIPFIWIGGGKETGKLTSKNISVTGWYERDAALSVLAGADLFVMPSLGEGLPVSLLEAMAMGKICIASDAPGIREVICHGENGFLAFSASEYADIITWLSKGFYDTEKISKQAADTITNKYSSEGMCRGYSAIYNGSFI